MGESLSIFLNQTPLGGLILDASGDSYKLEYEASWISDHGYSVSPHLMPGSCDSAKVKRFLSNLLPEGRWLEELSTESQVSRSNIFGLIELIVKIQEIRFAVNQRSSSNARRASKGAKIASTNKSCIA